MHAEPFGNGKMVHDGCPPRLKFKKGGYSGHRGVTGGKLKGVTVRVTGGSQGGHRGVTGDTPPMRTGRVKGHVDS